jgi:uncharacterized membrane protein YoaK (UPF0700 family)
MTRYDQRMRLFAACLSSLAGYVDAIGFIQTGGFFVSFMSGNSTRVGVGLAEVATHGAVAAGLIGCFLIGVVAGAFAGRLGRRRRRVWVLGLLALLLASAALFGALDLTAPAIVLMAMAMGAENAVFTEAGEVRIGLTYMTGTLVKLGHRVDEALFGGDPWGWLPYFLLWAGLIAGAATGAAAYGHFGLTALWGAVLATLVLTAVAIRLGPDPMLDRAPTVPV